MHKALTGKMSNYTYILQKETVNYVVVTPKYLQAKMYYNVNKCSKG